MEASVGYIAPLCVLVFIAQVCKYVPLAVISASSFARMTLLSAAAVLTQARGNLQSPFAFHQGSRNISASSLHNTEHSCSQSGYSVNAVCFLFCSFNWQKLQCVPI